MRYEIPLRYLARFYTDAPASLARARVLGRLAAALEVDDFSVEPLTQVTLTSRAVHQRVAISTPDGYWQVLTGGDSVDLVCHHGPTSPAANAEVGAFIRRAGEVLSIVADEVGLAHRLACVTEGFLPSMTSASMDRIAGSLLRFPPRFEPAPREWDWRCVGSVDRAFGQHREATNAILSIKRVQGTILGQGDFDRLRLDVDVNTDPREKLARFDKESVAAFFRAAVDWHGSLADEVLAFINIGDS